MNGKRDKEDESGEMVVVEVSVAIDQPDGGGVLNRRGLRDMDGLPYSTRGGEFPHVRGDLVCMWG